MAKSLWHGCHSITGATIVMIIDGEVLAEARLAVLRYTSSSFAYRTTEFRSLKGETTFLVRKSRFLDVEDNVFRSFLSGNPYES
jgi:hypothetical protein